MGRYTGNNIEYRGFAIVNNRKNKSLDIYDENGNYVKRVDNFSHGSITECKNKIDWLINKYGS